MSNEQAPILAVPFPAEFRGRLLNEHRMGVWRVDVELVDGTVVGDLFTNGATIYRLVGWDRPGFRGERGTLPFTQAEIRDVRQPEDA